MEITQVTHLCGQSPRTGARPGRRSSVITWQLGDRPALFLQLLFAPSLLNFKHKQKVYLMGKSSYFGLEKNEGKMLQQKAYIRFDLILFSFRFICLFFLSIM